MTKSDLLFSRI